jgi:hypothetical protein
MPSVREWLTEWHDLPTGTDPHQQRRTRLSVWFIEMEAGSRSPATIAAFALVLVLATQFFDAPTL